MAQGHNVEQEPRDAQGRWTKAGVVSVNLSPEIRAVLDSLRAAGGHPFIVGGSVRDAALGHVVKDTDIEVGGLTHEQVVRALSKHGVVDQVGKSFGVYKVRLSNGEDLDISLPRRERKTAEGHKGFAVEPDPFMSPQEAAARRDFTINSLMYDPHTGTVHDYHGGLADLKNKRLRHVGPAFGEDPLRVLRAMQFAARFGFDLDPHTAQVAQGLKKEYTTIAKERIWTEWEKVAQKAKQPSKAIDVLRATGWIDFYPELKALDGVPQEPDWHPEGGVLTHTKHVMDEAARIADRDHLKGDQRTILILAALCHDFGKAIPGITQVTEKNGVQRITSYGHDDAGVDPSRSFLERIGCPLSLRQSILTLVKEHMAHTGVQANHRTVTRLAHRLDPVTVRDWERIVEADHSGRPPLPKSRPAKGWLDIAETLGASKGKVKPLIGGDMLIARGLKPGPQFKGILNAAYDAQMDKEVTAENAAGWLDRYLAEHGFVSSMKNKSQQPLLFLAKAEHDVSDEPRDKDGKWTKEPGSGIPTAAERAAYAKRVAENPQPGDTVFVGDKTMADYGDIYEVTKGAHENGLQNNLIKIRKSYWAEGKEASASLGVWQKYIKDGNLIPRMPGDVAPDPSPEMLKEIRKDCATKEVQQIKDWAYSGYMPSQVLEKTLNVLCLKPPKDFSFTLKAAVPGVSQLSTGKEWTVTEGPKTTSLKSKVTLTAKDGEKVTLSVKDWVKTARSGEVPFTVKQVTDLLPTKCQECGKEIQGKDIHTCPFCSNEYCAADIAKHEETCSEKAVCAKCGKVMKKTDAVKCPYCGKTFCVEHASADDHDCPSTVACSVCGHKTYYKYMTKDPTTGKVYCQHDAEQVLGAADFDGDGVLGVSDIVSNNELARKTKDRLVRTILARLKDNPDFDDFLKDRKRLRYVLPGTAMATGQSEAYEAVNSLIKSWAVTSCDNNRLAIALQKAAIKEFNLSDNVVERPWESRTLYDASSSVPVEVRQKAIDDSEPAMRAFLRAMYDNTQEYFARKGVKNVTLYRGFSYDTKGLEELRGTLTGGMSKPIAAEAKLQPMSSFSTDVQTADTFSGDRGLAVVMETKDVPVEDVLSTAMTGFGCLNEQEMVVLGNSLKPCLVGPISAWRNKQTKQSNGKKFWYDVLPKNEDVLVAKSERRRPLQISVDRDIQNADWTKQSWDLPTYKSKGFWRSLKTSGMDLAHFRTLPVFKHLFRRHGVTKSQQPLLLLTKAHDVSKEPRDKQGKWAKVNGLPADVQIDPGDQALHDLFHGDHFELTATPRKNDYYGDNDYVLSIKPRLDKRYHQEVPGSFADDPPKGWYDTRLAHVEKGEGHGIYQPHYVRLNSNLPAEYSENLPEKEEPGHIWRGLSWEEMQAIKKNGAIRSNGQYNIGDIQKGLTYFADDPQTAESYAGNFAPPASIPTFDRPSYLVKMADPGDNTAVRLPHIEGEVGLKGAIPANKIEAIYEMQPFNVDAGEYELRTDHGLPKPTFSKGSGSKPGADYVFRKVTDVPGFLQGKEGKMTKSFDPNQPRDERGRWTKLAQGELAGMAADAKKYKDFHDYALDWSVMGMRGQYWHLTSKKNFKIDSTYVPHEYASNAAGIEGDGRSGLMVSGDPEWWHQQLPRGRRWAAEIDLSHAIRNRDYTVTNRGFGAEVFISNPAAVSVKRVVPYKQAVQEAQHYTEVGPQSEEDLRDFWTAVNKTTVPAAKSHQSLVLLNKPLPEVGDEVRIRNFRHPLSPYPLIVHGVGNDGNVQVRRLDTPKGALVSVPLKHLLLTRRAAHRKNDKPQPSSGFPNPYAAMAGYLDTTKSHDVSQEPRDEKGRWTAVGRLVYHLQQNKSPELHELVDNVHWGLGPSGVMPAKARRTYIDYTQDGLLAARETGYSRNQDAYYKTKDVIQKLDEQDQDTLERLIRGDIPAEWGHDPAYIDHLKKWGNGSKLLDDEGVPYRLYHGTPSVFRAFDPTKRGSSTHMSDAKKAFFFTGSPEDAGFFSFFPVMQKYDDFQSVREGKNPAESGTPNVMPVHVRLRKPLVLVDESGAMDMELLNGALDLAHRKGYDGIVMYVGVSPIEDHLKFVREDALPFKKVGSVKATGMSTSIYDPGNAILPRQSNMVVCAFNPVDVKSALGDNGNFDESSDLGKSHELLLLSKSGHDVSGEPRDKNGEWTKGEGFDSFKRQNQQEIPVLDKAFQGWAASLTPGQRAAIKLYTQPKVYKKLNNALRSPKNQGKPLKEYLNENDFRIAALFSKAIQQGHLPKDMTLFRGLDGDFAQTLASAKPGDVVSDSAFLSTSINPLWAQSFAEGPQGVIVQIHAPQGTPAAYINAVDLSSQEHELTLPRKTKLRVIAKKVWEYSPYAWSADKPRKYTIVEAKVLPQEVVKSHDVSGEPRDKKGRWVAAEALRGFLHQYGLNVHDVLPAYRWGSPLYTEFDYDANLDAKTGKPTALPPYDSQRLKEVDPKVRSVLDSLPEEHKQTMRKLAAGYIPATYLHGEQYVRNLRRWAGKSKLVDGDGLPLRFYHGTNQSFHSFDETKRGVSTNGRFADAKEGFFFTNAPRVANYFAFYQSIQKKRLSTRKPPQVYPVYLRSSRPLYAISNSSPLDPKLLQEGSRYAKEHGYDSFVLYPWKSSRLHAELLTGKVVARLKNNISPRSFDDPHDPKFLFSVYDGSSVPLAYDEGMTVVVFDNHNIKSAIGDNGNFDESAEMDKSHDVSGEPRDEKGRWTAGRWAQQAREHGMSEKAYIQAANENLKRIIKPARTWIGISPEHLSGVLDAGKYSSRLDDSLGLEDDESAAWVNETRERIERHFFGSPNVNPVYGFLSMDPTEGLTTDRDQPGDNYGSAFIKLKPEVAKRSGIFVGDSGTTYMPPTDGFGEPLEDEDPPEIDAELSPLTNPSIHSVPKEGGIDPLKIKKLSDIQPYVEVLVRPEGNRPAVSLSDIEEVVFTDKPDQGIVTKLHAKGIPFRVFERPQGERSRVPTNEHEAIDFAVKNPFRAVFGKVNPESTEPKLQRAKKMNMRLMAYSSSTGSTTMSKMDSITFGEPGYTQATLTMQELEQFVRNGDIPVMTKETIENAQNSGYLFNPWWQGGTVKSTPQGSPLVLTKSAHDVSNEPRDKDGRWTAMARLDSNLKRKRLGSLDTLVRTLIDDTNSNRLGPQGYFYNIAGVSESDYDPEVPYTSSPDTIATVRQLDPQDRDTLRRLVYGDIPVSRGHDAVYLAHLKHWAEGSKLVDEGGLPYRVFHGSDAKFRAFSIKKRGNATHYQDAKKAFFFTANPTDASRFATLAYRSRKNPGNDRAPQVYATYVRLKKPLVVLDGSGAISAVVMRQALDYATNHGYDGVVMYEQDRPEELFSAAALDRVETVYDYRGRASSMYSTGGTLPRGGDMVIAVIAPADIKSATGNRGTFSESSDIGKSQGLLLLGKSGHDVADEPRNRQGEWTKVAHDNHHGSMAGKRGIDPTVPYWIYLNLHLGTKKPLISKKTGQPVKSPKTGKVVMVPDQKVWSMKNWKTGLVDQHTGTVYLKGVRMHIGQAGRRKVIQTGTKNVHAGVVGMVVKPEEAPVEGWQDLHYNPKDHPELAHGFFMLADPQHPDQRISHAKYVRFTPQGTQVWGPIYKKGPHDDDLYLGSEANGPRAQKGVSHILAQVEPVATTKSIIFLEKSATRRRTVKRPGSRGGVGFRDVHGNWRYGRQKPGQPGPFYDAAWQKAVGAVVTKSEGEPEGYRYYQMNSGALIRHRDNEQPEMFHPVHRAWVPYQHLVDFAYKATPVSAGHAQRRSLPTVTKSQRDVSQEPRDARGRWAYMYGRSTNEREVWRVERPRPQGLREGDMYDHAFAQYDAMGKRLGYSGEVKGPYITPAPTAEELNAWDAEAPTIAQKASRWPLGKPLYIRWNKIPKSGRSVNHATGQRERGLSVYAARYNPQSDRLEYNDDITLPGAALTYLMDGRTPAYLVTGDEIARGSDGEPVLGNVKVLGQLKADRKGFDLWGSVTKSHDVSHEARDARGRWVKGVQAMSEPAEIQTPPELIDGVYNAYLSDEKVRVRTKDRVIASLAARLKDNSTFVDFARGYSPLLAEGGRYVDSVKDAVSTLVHLWATTSCDSYDFAIAMQKAAAQEFGLDSYQDTWSGRITKNTAKTVDDILAHDGPALRAFLRAMYDNTQAYFNKKGIKEVSLYRGFSVDPDTVKGISYDQLVDSRWGDGPSHFHVQARLQPMSSFSTNLGVSQAFAKPTGSKLPVVIKVDHLPVQDILATALTGVGCLREEEMVVLGRKDYPATLAIPDIWGTDYQDTAQAFWPKQPVSRTTVAKSVNVVFVYPDATLENADWPKCTWDLPAQDSSEFKTFMQVSRIPIEVFKALPVYQLSTNKQMA